MLSFGSWMRTSLVPPICTPACYRVGRCRSFRPSSLKTTQCSRSCEMCNWNPATTRVHLVHFNEPLRSSSALARGFLRIASRQHLLVCLRENGLSWILPYSARIIDRSPYWPTIGNIMTSLSAMTVESTWSTIPRLRPLSIFPMSWSVGILTRSLGLFSRTVELIDRLGLVGFCWFIDGESHIL